MFTNSMLYFCYRVRYEENLFFNSAPKMFVKKRETVQTCGCTEMSLNQVHEDSKLTAICINADWLILLEIRKVGNQKHIILFLSLLWMR